MAEIPDFSDSDLRVIRGTLSERYGKGVAIELADAELRPPHGTHSHPMPGRFLVGAEV